MRIEPRALPSQVAPVGSGHTTFQILSLDGGGIKGLFAAAVLAQIEEDLQVNVADHFDLITGTSTGGIIAIGLSIGLRPREIVSFYVGHGPAIFQRRRLMASLQGLWSRKYSQDPLRSALSSCFGDKRLADCRKRLVIPSYNLDKDDVHLFKTPHHPKLTRDWKIPLWKVALATTAAPSFFPVCRHVDHMRLIDGGVWANNPSMVGVVEAISMLGQTLESLKVLSIGTTKAVADKSSRLNEAGLFGWRSAAIDVAMRGQSVGVQCQVQHLLGQDRCTRLDPVVPDGLFALDKLTEARLLSEASHASRHFSPLFKDRFSSHRASPFHSLIDPVIGQTHVA